MTIRKEKGNQMSGNARREKRLSIAEKFSRLRLRLRQPEWRRYGGTMLAGKVLGVGIVLAIMAVVAGLFFTHVYAQTAAAPEVKASDVVNPVNTAWTLVAAFLVFGMQVGFTMLEAGFCRSRETVNVLVECVVDTCLCGILFYAIGFAFMFSHGNGSLVTMVLPAKRARHLRNYRRGVFGRLDFPIRIRGHMLDDHVGLHDRPNRIRRRPSVQHLRHWFHLPNHRTLGLGPGRLAGEHGQCGELFPITGNGLS